MSKTIGELEAGRIAGTLTESEKLEMEKLTDSAIETGRRISLGFDELIRSIDPYRRKKFLAALIVAGRRRGLAIYDSEEFQADLAKHVSREIDEGKTGFLQDLSELAGKPDVENRQSCYLSVIMELYAYEERWPTKRESEESASESFPEVFQGADEKEWRRLRKQLNIDWLENDKRRTKRGA